MGITDWIFTLLAIVTVIYSLTKSGKDQKTITLMMATGIVVGSLWKSEFARPINQILLLATAALTMLYTFREKAMELVNRVYVGVSGVLFVLFYIALIFTLPGLRELRIAMLTPLIIFTLTFFIYKKRFTKEFGFMVLWWALAFKEFLILFFD